MPMGLSSPLPYGERGSDADDAGTCVARRPNTCMGMTSGPTKGWIVEPSSGQTLECHGPTLAAHGDRHKDGGIQGRRRFPQSPPVHLPMPKRTELLESPSRLSLS